MAQISVSGGSLNTSLSTGEAAVASTALHNVLITDILYAPGGGSQTVNGGAGQKSLVISDINPLAATTLVGHGENMVLAGNQGNDLFLMKGQGSILGGDGNDTVALWARTPSTSTIILGNGNDSINVHNLGKGSGADLGNNYDTGFTFGNGTGDTTLQNNNGGVPFWTDNAQENGINAPPVSITLGDGNDTVYVSGLGSVTAGNGNDFFSFGKNGSVTAGDGQDTVTVTGNATIGLGNGMDSVSVGGAGNVTVGNGNDTINIAGAGTVVAGNGNDSISIGRGGAVTIGSGSDTISLLGSGSNLTQLGVTGHDTITLGLGRDTVSVEGMATVNGTNLTTQISATLAGGGVNGPETLTWLNGQLITIAGGGSATIQAGSLLSWDHATGSSSAAVTMSGGSGHNLYSFQSSTPGGSFTINNFVESGSGQDLLFLGGYNVNTVIANDITYTGSAGHYNATINLGDGTTITLNNLANHLNNTNIHN